MAGTVALQNVTRVAVGSGTPDSGTWSATGGGAGLDTNDTELFLQGTSSVTIQVSNKTNFGVNYAHNVTIDLTNEVIMAKVANSTFGNISGAGLRIRYGDTASDYYQLTIATSAATYQSFSQGVNKFAWWTVPIQPALTGYTATTGSPDMSIWDYAGVFLTNNSSARTNNLAMDAIDYCSDSDGGLTVTGGTVPSPATYDDFPAYDDDTVANKYGFALRQVGGIACAGTIQVGTSGTSVIFDSVSESLTWIDAAVPAGFMRCVYDLQNASTDIDLDRLVAKSEGNVTTTDTRFDVTVVGTSGALDANASSWLNARNVILTSAATFVGCTFQCEDLTQGAAHIDGGTILTTSAANTAVINDATFGTTSGIHGVEFVQDDAGHAIEITVAGSYTFTDITFTGYGGTPGSNLVSSSGDSGAAVYNSSGGAVTINVEGGGSPSCRNNAGSTTTVQSTVPVAVNVIDDGGTPIEDALVTIHKNPQVSFLAGAGNTAGDGDLVISTTIPADTPSAGWVFPLDDTNCIQGYRYTSWSTSTFTFPTEVTGNTTSEDGSDPTKVIKSTSTNFLTADIEEGDTVRNTTDGSWGIIDEVVDADTLLCIKPLQGGADNTWQSGDAFSFHKLATSLTSGTNIVDVPLLSAQTDSNGDASLSFNYQGSEQDIKVDVRKSQDGETRYVSKSAVGAITATGFATTVELSTDTVA